jgi:hypothetical protein
VVWYKGFLYQAASWKMARRMVAKVEFHFGELFPRVGFIVTSLSLPSRAVVGGLTNWPMHVTRTAQRSFRKGAIFVCDTRLTIFIGKALTISPGRKRCFIPY